MGQPGEELKKRDRGEYEILSDVSAVSIACDKENNIWISHGLTDFTKLSTNGQFILSGSIGNATSLSSRNITFTNEYIQTISFCIQYVNKCI